MATQLSWAMNNVINRNATKQYSVGLELGMAWCLLIGLLISVAWLALNRMERIENNMNELVQHNWAKVKLARQDLARSAANNRITLQVFLMDDVKEIESLLAERAQ